MKFYNYIKEEENWLIKSGRLDPILKDCMPYLKKLKKNNFRFIYSGRKTGEVTFKKNIRKDRKPSDMPEEIHNILDEKFKEKFGVKVRSESLFGSVRINQASFYGIPYYIFPIGNNYSLIWNENIRDLYENLRKEMNRWYPGIQNLKDQYKLFRTGRSDINHDEFLMNLRKAVQNLMNGYKETKSIPSYISKKVEIMVNANKVWLVRDNEISHQEIINWLDKNI